MPREGTNANQQRHKCLGKQQAGHNHLNKKKKQQNQRKHKKRNTNKTKVKTSNNVPARRSTEEKEALVPRKQAGAPQGGTNAWSDQQSKESKQEQRRQGANA
jgi:hypothetical protein